MHFFHKWSNWEPYKQPMISTLSGRPFNYVENWQRRRCLICGFVQEQQI